MGNYQLPKTSAGLIDLGTANIAGMQLYGTALGIKLISLAQCESNLAGFVHQDGIYNAARSAAQSASDAYQATLGPIYEWDLGVSNTLATQFGTRWNTEWAQAGFINHTTAIPTRIEDRLALTLALVNFFTANPSFEVPGLNQTAALRQDPAGCGAGRAAGLDGGDGQVQRRRHGLECGLRYPDRRDARAVAQSIECAG